MARYGGGCTAKGCERCCTRYRQDVLGIGHGHRIDLGPDSGGPAVTIRGGATLAGDPCPPAGAQGARGWQPSSYPTPWRGGARRALLASQYYSLQRHVPGMWGIVAMA